MSRTLDSFPGFTLVEGIDFDEKSLGEEPSDPGGIRYISESFSMRDHQGLFDPRTPNTLLSASGIGQVLFSCDGLSFASELPITTQNGWLVNNSGILLVVG